MGEVQNATREKLGISEHLPPEARFHLVHAHDEAVKLPRDSIERRKVIEQAVEYVVRNWPEYYREDCM